VTKQKKGGKGKTAKEGEGKAKEREKRKREGEGEGREERGTVPHLRLCISCPPTVVFLLTFNCFIAKGCK